MVHLDLLTVRVFSMVTKSDELVFPFSGEASIHGAFFLGNLGPREAKPCVGGAFGFPKPAHRVSFGFPLKPVNKKGTLL